MKTVKALLTTALCATIVCGCSGDKQQKTNSSTISTIEMTEDNKPTIDNNDSISQQANNNTKEKIVLLDFYATWCGPCKAMAPILEKMEKKYGDKIEFRKVDVDQDPELAQQYEISGIPTLVILSSTSDVVKKIVGAQPEDELDRFLGGL